MLKRLFGIVLVLSMLLGMLYVAKECDKRDYGVITIDGEGGVRRDINEINSVGDVMQF